MTKEDLGYIDKTYFYYWNAIKNEWIVYYEQDVKAFSPVKRFANGYLWLEGWENAWPLKMSIAAVLPEDMEFFKTWDVSQLHLVWNETIYSTKITYNVNSKDFPSNLNKYSFLQSKQNDNQEYNYSLDGYITR